MHQLRERLAVVRRRLVRQVPMAAGALAYLQGGDNEQIVQAATFSLKNMLGLACDPVGGLVEVPCIKRNVAGVMNAVAGAQLAMLVSAARLPRMIRLISMRRIGKIFRFV